MNVLISACLLGVGCRYDGRGFAVSDGIRALSKEHNLIPVCPEITGGLCTPRDPSELQGDKVVSKSGKDVTAAYVKGADEILSLAEFFDCKAAILKARSPSCGRGKIYDGTFSGKLTDGNGITADLLLKSGVSVFTEDEVDRVRAFCSDKC